MDIIDEAEFGEEAFVDSMIAERCQTYFGDEEDASYDDHDPINGRYVNKEDEELLRQLDVAKTEKERKAIHKKCVSIYKEEAKKNNPLALFYLGVCCLNGNNVKKDLQKGKELLEKAHELGVKRAMDFLVSYFDDYGVEVPIISNPLSAT